MRSNPAMLPYTVEAKSMARACATRCSVRSHTMVKNSPPRLMLLMLESLLPWQPAKHIISTHKPKIACKRYCVSHPQPKIAYVDSRPSLFSENPQAKKIR